MAAVSHLHVLHAGMEIVFGGARVVRVESQSANTIAKINADLLGLTTGT